MTLAEDELAFDSDQFSTYVLALTSLQHEMRSTDGKTVTDFADRSVLFCGQSPEVFNLRKYLQLNLQTPQQELETIRGGCELAFKYGMKVGMISGEDKNFKLTTPSDMYRMKLNLDCAE